MRLACTHNHLRGFMKMVLLRARFRRLIGATDEVRSGVKAMRIEILPPLQLIGSRWWTETSADAKSSLSGHQRDHLDLPT